MPVPNTTQSGDAISPTLEMSLAEISGVVTRIENALGLNQNRLSDNSPERVHAIERLKDSHQDLLERLIQIAEQIQQI